MITAIPIKKNRIATHFTKAECFVFLDETGKITSTEPNPALNSNCSGKSALQALLSAQNTDRVIVRHIGERMLGRLLNNKMAVFQVDGDVDDAANLATENDNLTALTHPKQGKKSPNFESKNAGDGGGCNHGHHQQDPHQHDGHGAKKCCKKDSTIAPLPEGHGHRPCCKHR